MEGSGKKCRYAAAERLYCIYYKLRRERDEAAIVQHLIQFMMVFYSKKEIARFIENLILEAVQSPLIREGFERAMTNILPTTNIAIQEIGEALTGRNFRKVLEITDRLLASLSTDSSSDDDGPIASILLMKSIALVELEQYAMAIEVCDEIIERFSARDEPLVQMGVARALDSKGKALQKLGKSEVAISVYDEVIKRYRANNTLLLQIPVAGALVSKGMMQTNCGNFKAAIATFDEVIERFNASNVPELQLRLALGLVNKGIAQWRLSESEAAIASFEEVIGRFGTGDTQNIQAAVAEAMLNKGIVQWERGESEAAIATFDELIQRFGPSDNHPAIRASVAEALVHKGDIQIELGRMDEALLTLDEISRVLGASTDGEAALLRWRVQLVRTAALLTQEQHSASMDTFREVYTMFDPGNETMMRGMLNCVPTLVVAGASERDLADILASDPEKRGTLEPLVVALRQMAGETVRAPAEVLEVATDVRQAIEERRSLALSE